MRQRGIVADYVRHPNQDINRMIENLLISAGTSLRAGDYQQTQKIIGIIQSMLLHPQTQAQNKFWVEVSTQNFSLVYLSNEIAWQNIDLYEQTPEINRFKIGPNNAHQELVESTINRAATQMQITNKTATIMTITHGNFFVGSSKVSGSGGIGT
jgi:hypothetical protein